MNKYEVIADVLNKLKYGTGEWVGFSNDLCNRIHDGAHNYIPVDLNDVLPVVLEHLTDEEYVEIMAFVLGGK